MKLSNIKRITLIRTEKSTNLKDKGGWYALKSPANAGKADIVAFLKKFYNVDVKEIRSLVIRPKKKTIYTVKARSNYETKEFKKFYVKLAEGQSLSLYNK